MSYRLQSLRSTPRTTGHNPHHSDEPPASSSAPRTNRKRGVSQVEPPNPIAQPNHATSNANIKKQRTTVENGSGDPDISPDQPVNTGKRTRPSNNEHPALRPGVLKKLHEPREEIAARAAEKRAEGEAKKETKRLEQLEKRKIEERGKAKIAAAMNESERETREREEMNKLPFGGNVEVPAFDGGFGARVVRKDSAGAQTVSPLFFPISLVECLH